MCFQMNYIKGYRLFVELSIKLICCWELHFLIDQHVDVIDATILFDSFTHI